MKSLRGAAILAVWLVAVSGCASGPVLPADLQGKAAIVMGFDTDTAKPYEGGTLYKGLLLERINADTFMPALRRYQYHLIEPGQVTVAGHCFWRLRGVMWDRPQDLFEPGTLTWEAKPDHVYTLFADIDEYKARCVISYFEQAPP